METEPTVGQQAGHLAQVVVDARFKRDAIQSQIDLLLTYKARACAELNSATDALRKLTGI